MPEFYIIIARKIFFPFFWGGVPPPPPVSYTYDDVTPSTPSRHSHIVTGHSVGNFALDFVSGKSEVRPNLNPNSNTNWAEVLHLSRGLVGPVTCK